MKYENDFSAGSFETEVLSKLNRSWTLFLDRDGVINKKIDNDYVRDFEQFEILPGVLDALVHFSDIFGRIVVVTNQQGVGKGLMTTDDVISIHKYFLEKLEKHGGRIDAFYFAPQLAAENSVMRKPNIGMALQAKKDFSEIDFDKSIMVGDAVTDMEFANRAGMHQIYITADETNNEYFCIKSLQNLASVLLAARNTQ